MSHSVTSILSQIRSFQSQITQPASVLPTVTEAPRDNALGAAALGAAQPQPASFSETLRGALSSVNQAQHTAGALARDFELGVPGADLAKVMVASQQSQIAFRATVEVRNRLVQAYQDVMNMPL